MATPQMWRISTEVKGTTCSNQVQPTEPSACYTTKAHNLLLLTWKLTENVSKITSLYFFLPLAVGLQVRQFVEALAPSGRPSGSGELMENIQYTEL